MSAKTIALVSVFAVGLLTTLLILNSRSNPYEQVPTNGKAVENGPASQGSGETEPYIIYCAAGIRPPVEELAAAYRKQYGVAFLLDGGNSGELLAKLKLEAQGNPRGHLYIPADRSYLEDARKNGLIAEIVDLARFRLVLAVKPGNPKKIETFEDVFREDVEYVLCQPQAGVGKVTQEVLEPQALFERLKGKAKAMKPRVTEAAMDVKASNVIDAAFLWDSTARQFGLEIVSVPELEKGVAAIGVGLTAWSEDTQALLRFARFMASPEHGEPVFRQHHYEAIRGDAWAETPELTLFAGGLNRDAVKETLEEFQRREGCRINPVYAGCGTLVNMIQTQGGLPDAFLTCNKAYLEKVPDVFVDAQDVSDTRLVLLVRKDRAGEIRSLQDLAKEGVTVGVTDEGMSALGWLTAQVLRDLGLYEKVKPNIKVATGTAHELIMQVQGGARTKKLDAAVVYEANCQNIDTDLVTMVPVDHPGARAVQNVAPSKGTKYPQLARRLMDALLSRKSQQRFTSQGFGWQAGARE